MKIGERIEVIDLEGKTLEFVGGNLYRVVRKNMIPSRYIRLWNILYWIVTILFIALMTITFILGFGFIINFCGKYGEWYAWLLLGTVCAGLIMLLLWAGFILSEGNTGTFRKDKVMYYEYKDSVGYRCKLDVCLPVAEWQKKYDELKNWYLSLFEDYLFKCEIRSDSYGFYIYLCAEKEIVKPLEYYLDSNCYDYEKYDSLVLRITCDSDEFEKEFNEIDIIFK